MATSLGLRRIGPGGRRLQNPEGIPRRLRLHAALDGLKNPLLAVRLGPGAAHDLRLDGARVHRQRIAEKDRPDERRFEPSAAQETDAERIEDEIRELEELRFVNGRIYNYSALVEALKIAGFPDVDPGDGGPFNAPPPPEIRQRLVPIVERLRTYHSAASYTTR